MPTRREFLAGSTAALVGSAIGRGPAWAWMQTAGTFTPIRRNVGHFTGRGGTIGHLVNADGVLVVDSQYPEYAAQCIAGLKEQSGGKPVDLLINTHHHGDHVAGNIAFRGVAKRVLAHETAAAHMRQPPGRQSQAGDQLYPDRTFTSVWREQLGDEWVRAQHHGRAHTSGDAIITFENANVAHMGDLVFNRRHPVIDRPAGASIADWANVVDRAVADHERDTIFIFGHAGSGQPVVGSAGDLGHFAGYLRALLEFVDGQRKAGRSREEIEAIRDPLPRFDDFGPLTAYVLGNAYGELAEGTGDAPTPAPRDHLDGLSMA